MKRFYIFIQISLFCVSCSIFSDGREKKIIFLAHSTGTNLYELGEVENWFEVYNREHDSQYRIEILSFPGQRFYGWRNYPYDYWNIWVNHNGYKFEPSLGKLNRKYDLVVWKHCYPGSRIEEDSDNPSVYEEQKSIAAYKLQYNALKEAMRSYPQTDFLVWTLAVMREEELTINQAERAKEFVEWVKSEWDEPGDNIHIWDFYHYSTTSSDGLNQSLFLRPEYASNDAHPNETFNKTTAPYFCERMVDILSGKE